MDITLSIYKDRLCRHIDKTVTAPDFSLSLGICEEVVNLISLDSISGFSSLSVESQMELLENLIGNGLPYFKDLLKEIFELTDQEIENTKSEDIIEAIINIFKYAWSKMGKHLVSKN